MSLNRGMGEDAVHTYSRILLCHKKNELMPLASLVAQLVKNPPAIREIWVRSLGWEDPLENGKATHSSILAWSILRTI